MEGKNVLLFRSQLKANIPKYEAIAEFSYLGQQYLKWSGDLSLTEKKSSLNAKLEGTAHDPILLSGDWINSGDRHTATATIKSSFITARVSGILNIHRISLVFAVICIKKGNFLYLAYI